MFTYDEEMHSDSEWLPEILHSVPDPNQTYYVIIGLGFSALANHLTLISSNKDRVGNLPILHIGEYDPWQRYSPIQMGQWPALLSLPGFSHAPVAGETDFLPSTEFAAVLRKQWFDLHRRGKFSVMIAQVTRVTTTNSPFLLQVGAYNIQAAKIDVCGGPGPARKLDRNLVRSQSLWDEYQNPAAAAPFPRLVAAEDYLCEGTPRANDGLVLVFGGGPTGAWCVETALARNHPVLWVSIESLLGAFVKSGRNDHLAQTPINKVELFPSEIRRLTFAEYYRLIAVQDTGRLLRAEFKKISGKARYVQKRMPSLGDLQTEEVSQVIVATGQQDDYWENLLNDTLARDLDRKFILDRFDRIIGLQSEDGNCRILGAAAFGSRSFKDHIRSQPDHPSKLYEATLPHQARQHRNIVHSAVTIAEANHLWTDEQPNPNVNTAHRNEISRGLEMRSRQAAPLLDRLTSWPYRDRYLPSEARRHLGSTGSESEPDDRL